MKRLALILMMVAGVGMPSQLLAEDVFRRMTSSDDLTENADYLVGVVMQSPHSGPWVLYVLSSKSFKTHLTAVETAFREAPETLEAPEGNCVWRIVRCGGDIALRSAAGQYISNPKGSDLSLTASPSFWTPQDEAMTISLQNTATGKYLGGGHLSRSPYTRYFGAYAEGPLCLYKREQAPESLTAYERFWEADGCETLCLPFACTVPQPFTAYAVSEGSGDQPAYTPTTSLGAGQPAVIKGPKGLLFRVEAVGPPAAAPQPAYLTGTFRPLRLNQGRVLTDQGFEPVAEGCFLPAFRAYLK